LVNAVGAGNATFWLPETPAGKDDGTAKAGGEEPIIDCCGGSDTSGIGVVAVTGVTTAAEAADPPAGRR
jgi:hypothetical protein